MYEKFKQFATNLTEKIPREKRPAVLIVCGIIVMLIIMFSGTSGEKEEIVSAEDNITENYVQETERKLSEIIGSINGAGKTKVMVTLDSGEENIYACDINEDRNEYVVIKTSSQEGGLLLKIVQPKIRGVAVVCDGGDSYKVQSDILSAVCSVLDISSARVSITKMKN